MKNEDEMDKMMRENNPFGSDSLVEGLVQDAQARTRRNSWQRPPSVPKRKARAVLESFANIEPEPIAWLWHGRIALGKLTLIAGDPGLGKSLLTTTLAACVSRGYPWPVDGTDAPLGDVILLSAEDDAADTIRPRLDAAEADVTRVQILKAVYDEDDSARIFSLKRDIEALEEALSSIPECRLLIVDPVSAYLDGTDSHNNSDVRGLLAPLAELAGRYKIAVVLIHHLNKNAGGNALYRNIGSIAFTAAVRAAYVVAKDKDNPERRLLLPTKNNLAKDSTGLAYSIKSDEKNRPIIHWELEPVEITANEALALPETGAENADTDWAVEVLHDILAAGPVHSIEAIKQAKQAGLTEKQIRRAREKMGVEPRRTAYKGIWEWALPTEDAQDAHPKSEGTLEDKGHLGDASNDLDNF